MSSDYSETAVVAICDKFHNDRTRLMDILHEVQSRFRCVNAAAMETIARQIGSYRVEVEGMVSFYAFFSEAKQGDVTIRLCDDIVDRHAGVATAASIFSRILGVNVGETSSDGRFTLGYTPCIGMCDQAPAALINDTVVTRLTAEFAHKIADQLKRDVPPHELFLPVGEGCNRDPAVRSMVLNNIREAGEVLLGPVPDEAGLRRALTLTPQQALDEIDASRLTGRGGAGFPTGKKWRAAAETQSARRVIICNADEGEPGTFKDRVLLTERTNLLIEGMTIAAFAVNSEEGLIYLRAEYAYLHAFIESILHSRRESGLLGGSILGRDSFSFDIRIQMGAGAYICGEESALISSCEGLRGEPKNRPPFPVQSGYLGHPTVVDNVESYCCAARILDRGASWFAGLGTQESTGTKLLSISGDVERPGVYELEFGVTVNELLRKAGGNESAAVQVGGPSGQMINTNQFERRICNEDLATGGAITVFSARRNIIDIVVGYMDFFVEESCGYCTPCRVGSVFLSKRMKKVRRGLCQPEDLDYLLELSNTIAQTSRCGLGRTAPNPVISTIKNFPLVYAALLKENKDGLNASFDIQHALEESRRLAKRRSMIYDPTYEDAS